MTISVTSCVAPSPASLALEALARLLDVPLELSEGDSVSLRVLTTNALTGISTPTIAMGWTGCTRLIAQQVPLAGLWGMSGADIFLAEGWLGTASKILIPVIQGEDLSLQEEKPVETFVSQIEQHLLRQTYLVGDVPTAADVTIAVWLAQACAVVQIEPLPQQTWRWMTSLVSHPKVALTLSSLPKEEHPSPLEKVIEPEAPVVEPETPLEKVVEPEPAPSATTTTTTTSSVSSSSLEFADNPIVQKLQQWSIPHSVYSHTLSNTAEDLVANVPIPEGDSHTKNLFFKDKKHGLFLVTLHTSSEINTKALGQMLKLEGKINLRLAEEATLMECLNVKPGSVGPLSVIHDTSKQVTLVLDQALLNVKHIHSHPLCNDASVILTPAALQEYLTKAEHEPVVLEFKAGASNSGTAPKPPPVADSKKAPKQKGPAPGGVPKEKSKDKKTSKKGETLLALQWKKSENFPMWYSDVIVLSEMIAYYDISGCYILRPWSYKIWELIQEWFNVKIRELDVENSYFPLFVSQDRLEKEKDHVEGFAPEVAWVTKSGDGTLAKPIAIRPTSETIMYPAFSDWIKSHRDLPLKLNQWSNVVRWEFKDPTPFLRSREFLWQEGHTAHVSLEDADVMVHQALELYRAVYEDLLAVPVIKGFKTEKEKFAGGHQTTTVEAYIPGSGRAIQGATSHNLGQNFGKMFDITFQNEQGKSQIAWQTSWGLTTRSIGVMIMVHGDDTGLVLPPVISPLQAVIVPIVSKKLSLDDAAPYCDSILKELKAAGIRAKYDDRNMYNPGWKYNHWEQKGVPIRIEVGPRDIEQKQVRVVIRYNGEKLDMAVDNLASALNEKLDEIQKAMFVKAKETRDQHLVHITEWKDFVPNLELNNLVMTPWCGGEHKEWEEWVKNKSREESLQSRNEGEEDDRTATSVAAKTLCIPFDQPELPEGTKCIASGMPAKCWVLWGRSY